MSRLSVPLTMAALMLITVAGLTPAAKAQSCTGLCLQQITCPSNGTTSISGKVYAPNGTDVLPGVLVYVPNAAVQPFAPGVQCLIAGQPASGSPLISTTTAADGTFTLMNAPVGSNIPLVIQAGKWRRQFVIPTVSSCANTPLPSTGASQIRFPRTQAEGDIPQIAIVTGAVDSLECVIRKIGVADSEFTTPTGTGRIRFYTGAAPSGAGATIATGTTPSETVLEASVTSMAPYDVVMLACQGKPYTPTATAQAALQSYANAGGRVFAEHYSYDFLTSNFPTVATWNPTEAVTVPDQIATINQAFPKGAELAQWLQNVGASTTLGQLPVQVIRKDQDGVVAPTQSFLSVPIPAQESIQFTFNTPVASPAASQCGRVLFNEYHVENASNNTGTVFPNECPAVGTPLTPQEQLLEFSLFDLSTFVSPDVPPTASVSFTNQAAPYIQGDTADTVVVTISNTSTTTPANPSLTATIALPVGLTATALAPQTAATSGWTCTLATLTCTRTTGLSASTSDALLLTFSVAQNSPAAASITATAAGGGLAANVSAIDSFPILIVPTITWATPAPIFYGTQLSGTQLNATATYNSVTVPGTLVYTPAAGSTPAVGSQQLSVLFTPSDPTTYTSASATVSLLVNQATPVITWATPAAIIYGTPLSGAQLNATATYNSVSVPGTLTYTPAANTVLGAGVGQTLNVLFTPNDGATYTTASGSVQLTVNTAPLTATAGSYSRTYDGSSHALSACVVSSNLDGITCTNNPVGPVGPNVSASTVTPVLAGATGNYSATLINGSYAITQASQTITFGALPNLTYGAADFQLGATASSGLAVSYTATGGCTILGSNTVHIVSAMACQITASQGGNGNYTAAVSVPQSFAIAPAPVTATGGSGNAQYDGTAKSPSACTVTGAFTGDLTCVNQPATVGPDAGTTVIAPYTTGTVLPNAAVTEVNGSFTITQAPSSVALNCPASVAYNHLAQTPCTAAVTGVGNLNQTVTVVYLNNVNAGTASASATYAGDTDHTGSSKSVNFAITKVAATVTPNVATKVYGAADPALTGSLSGFLAADGVSATYSRTSGETVAASPYTISATLSPAAALANYTITYNTAPFTITKATTTTAIAVTTTQTSSGTTATITATVSPQISGTPTGTVTYTNGTTVLGSAAVGTAFTTGVLPTGANSIGASYSGDANFIASASAKTTVTGVLPTTIQLIVPLPIVLYPLPVAYTVIVPLKNFQPISGTITIYDGNIALSTVPILPGGINVGLTLPGLSPGTHQLKAVYNGDSHYPAGQSPVITVTVLKL